MPTKPRTPTSIRAATDALLALTAAGVECCGTLADQIRALAAREERTAATLAETQRLLAETTGDRDAYVAEVERANAALRKVLQPNGQLLSARVEELANRHVDLREECREQRACADERGEALARIAETIGMAPHPMLVADQAIASVTSLRARVDAASANVAALAVLAAVCEMLAPESHASVTAKDYVTLARQAVSAARSDQ